jgi:hypothetical protein
MNLGYTWYYKSCKELFLLPEEHKVVGEAPSDTHKNWVKLLIEGPDMPLWREGEPVKEVYFGFGLTRQEGISIYLEVWWTHDRTKTWLARIF